MRGAAPPWTPPRPGPRLPSAGQRGACLAGAAAPAPTGCCDRQAQAAPAHACQEWGVRPWRRLCGPWSAADRMLLPILKSQDSAPRHSTCEFISWLHFRSFSIPAKALQFAGMLCFVVKRGNAHLSRQRKLPLG